MLIVGGPDPSPDETLAAALAADPRCEQIARAHSADEAFDLAMQLHPQLVLVTDNPAKQGWAEGLTRLREQSPESLIFIVTDVSGVLEIDAVTRALSVDGFVNRDRLAPDVGQALLDASLLSRASSTSV